MLKRKLSVALLLSGMLCTVSPAFAGYFSPVWSTKFVFLNFDTASSFDLDLGNPVTDDGKEITEGEDHRDFRTPTWSVGRGAYSYNCHRDQGDLGCKFAAIHVPPATWENGRIRPAQVVIPILFNATMHGGVKKSCYYASYRILMTMNANERRAMDYFLNSSSCRYGRFGAQPSTFYFNLETDKRGYPAVFHNGNTLVWAPSPYGESFPKINNNNLGSLAWNDEMWDNIAQLNPGNSGVCVLPPVARGGGTVTCPADFKNY
ncbi:hypothetical protein FNU76_21795 [Chitinimonas arctica]|uniref:Uncharacterized protein n=1 Tax=Chitinimonas arctica TaxID=2594795 RepID=A0A516SKT9_9NEIS|nr:DUF4179 domain-containing protein [Chitinimonas arctica]QDQ28770.1 hypothetical protein FNU76_21795 [Chitinimonas arctica]